MNLPLQVGPGNTVRTFGRNGVIDPLGDAAHAVLLPVIAKDESTRTDAPAAIMVHDRFTLLERFLPQDLGEVVR